MKTPQQKSLESPVIAPAITLDTSKSSETTGLENTHRQTRSAISYTAAPIVILSLLAGSAGCILNREGTALFNEGGTGGTGGTGAGGEGGIGGIGGTGLEGGGGTGGTGGTGLEGGGGTGGTGGIGGEGGEGGSCVPTGPEICDGLDNDCQNGIDDNPAIETCAEPDLGVCQGSTAARVCQGVNGWSPCGYLQNVNYQANTEDNKEKDNLNNDCDLYTDEIDVTLDTGPCRKIGVFYTFGSPTYEAGSSGDNISCETAAAPFMSVDGNEIYVWMESANSFTLTFPPGFDPTGFYTCKEDCSQVLNPPNHTEIDYDRANKAWTDIPDQAANANQLTITPLKGCGRNVVQCTQ